MLFADITKVKDFRPGSIHTITYGKELKTLKGVTNRVEKIFVVQGRFGVRYNNISHVRKRKFFEIVQPGDTVTLATGLLKKHPDLKNTSFTVFAIDPNSGIVGIKSNDGRKAKVTYTNVAKLENSNGEKPLLQSEKLPWGEWLDNRYFIKHQGKIYLRVTGVPGTRRKAAYFIDGKPATKDQVMQLCPKSEFKSPYTDIFTIGIDKIRKIV